MIWLLISLAAAADLDRYPWSAPVDTAGCAPCATGEGAVRVVVPSLLRSAEDPEDGTDLLLVDGAGEVVPVAWIRGRGSSSAVPLVLQGTEEPDVVLVEQLDRPIQGLTVLLPDVPSAATAEVEVQVDGAWMPHGEPTLVWRTGQGTGTDVPLPPTVGPLRLRTRHHHREPEAAAQVSGYRLPSPSLDPVTVEVPVDATALHESGWTTYRGEVPHALPITSLTPVVADDLFQRTARIPGPDEPWDEIYGYYDSYDLHRAHVGGATVDEVTVPWPAHRVSREVVLQVDTAGGAPLDVSALILELEGVEGVVLDPPPGPWTLYGGAPPGTSPVHDLRAAAPELFRSAEAVLPGGAVSDNPAYTPPEVRAGLALPGAELDLDPFAWRRAVQGPAGLAVVSLPADVLAECAPDQADLRVVDSGGRQVPFLLRDRVRDHAWEDLEVSRVEDGDVTRLVVTVPHPEVPVAGITLYTEAPLFSRTVTVSRARGASLETLRAYEWVGQDRPHRLVLRVDAVVGEALVVEVHNGDDPPLPVEVEAVTWPARDLLAYLPEGGAQLVYGAEGLDPPSYDLSLLRTSLLRRAAPEATLGPAEALEREGPSLVDRIVLMAGVGVLVLGLLGLTLSLLRRVPAEPEEDADAEE